ncbi:MAG: serine hydrolase [Pseudomonadales bacterium]|nr:serine hydrolase [Pseudomonadales bacterium]
MAMANISTKWRWTLAICAALIMIFLFVGPQVTALISIASGYKTKILCSGVFVSKRKEPDVVSEDFAAEDIKFLDLFTTTINHEKKWVTSHLFLWPDRIAVYREGLGCTLLGNTVLNNTVSDLPDNTPLDSSAPAKFQKNTPEIYQPDTLDSHLFWPRGSSNTLEPFPSNVNQSKLNQAFDWAFEEESQGKHKRTRALAVVHKGKLIAERYADHLSSQTPLHSWSMTKSMTNALTGIMIQKKSLFLEDDNLFIQWQHDQRGDITLDQLLRMSSGLSFYEKYDEYITDVSVMLYGVPDAGLFAINKQLESEPNTKWHYSSGTSNIIHTKIKSTFLSDLDAYLNFPRKLLFEPLGMHNTTMETDASNTFIGSSYVYSTARDWARFGLLYLQDGMWNDQRILPEGWVKYSRSDNGTDPHHQYAAHFWLQIPKFYKNSQHDEISLPEDMFFAMGYEGQFVTMIPSRDLVIVRMGLTRQAGAWDQALFVEKILTAFEAAK